MFINGSYHNATSEKKAFLEVSKHNRKGRASDPNWGNSLVTLVMVILHYILYMIYIYNIGTIYIGTTENICYPRLLCFPLLLHRYRLLGRLSKRPVLALLLQTVRRQCCRHLISILSSGLGHEKFMSELFL